MGAAGSAGATSDGGKYLAYICQPKKARRGKNEAFGRIYV